MIDLMRGVSFLHQQKYVHHDLKPANLLLSNGSLLIADFGFTTHESDTSPIIGGTPAYLSPEHSSNEAKNYKGDVWACGCIAFELITRTVKQMRKLCEASGHNLQWFKDLWSVHVVQTEDIAGLYSEQIYECIAPMLHEDVNKRISAEESLEQWMKLQQQQDGS